MLGTARNNMRLNNYRKIQKTTWISCFLLLVFFAASTFTGLTLNKRLKNAPEQRLQVAFTTKPGSKVHTTWIFGLQTRQINRLIERIHKRGLSPDVFTIQGVLLVDEPGTYSFALSANRSARLLIDGQELGRSSTVKKNLNRISHTYLAQRAHDFALEFTPASRGSYLSLLWKSNPAQDFHTIPAFAFFAPGSSQNYERLQQIQSESKRIIFLKNNAFLLSILSLLGLAFLLLKPLRRSETPVSVPQTGSAPSPSSRLSEIDKTKGFAGFLMIAAHLDGARLLAFGTFGAALFFLCSGMNTILFLDKTRGNKKYNTYHLFFVVLLFVGGYTQIVIAHPSETRLVPEFLQVSALAMLLIFVLSKFFKNIYHVGYLFWLPYLLHFLFQHGRGQIQTGGAARFISFFFGTGAFPLFPWAGFFLYGILLLALRRKKWALAYLTAATGIFTFFSIFIFNIPINKFDMSLSYVALSLFAATLLFYTFCLLTEHSFGQRFKILHSVLEVVGRNSLMFVYVHYLALDLLRLENLFTYPALALLFSTVLVFLFSAFLVFAYERVKNQPPLFLPSLLMLFLLLILKYGHYFSATADLKMINIVIGVIFAYLYVELRQKLRPARQSE
jgi:hypothetical protein